MDKMHNPHVKKVGSGIEAARKNINNNVGDVSDNVKTIKTNFS